MKNLNTNIPQYNYTITKYNAINQPTVVDKISVEQVLETIKNGDSNLPLIERARGFGKGSTQYNKIKEYELPTFRFNFDYKNNYAVDKNITGSTGLIYIDVDGADTVPESEYVYAKWKSLSNTGFGILVKVDNLTPTNYKYVYNELSEVIGIKSDRGARKVSQQTVLSYDSNLYHNSDSITYTYIEKENEIKIEEKLKKVSFDNTIKGKRGLLTNDTFYKNEGNVTYRCDNINDYFKDEYTDIPFLVFPDEKEKICQPYIPNSIPEGLRHNTMLSVLSNRAALNPHCDEEYLISISEDVLYKMEKKIPKHGVNRIIKYVIKMKDEGELRMYLNKEKRFLFNKKMKISRQEIYKIVGSEMGKIRRNKTETKIYQIIESWDFEANGKITGEKVAKISKNSLTTIKRYWSDFKDYVKDLNTSNKHDFKLQDKPS